MILSLDPSTTKTGIARFDNRGRFVSAELILPDRSKDGAIERVHQMAVYLAEYVAEVDTEHGEPVRVAVMEEPYISQEASRSAVGAQFLALGAFYHVLRRAKVRKIVLVSPSTWTRGKSKEYRAMWIRREFKIPDGQDSGNDAVDAIGLGLWWIQMNPQSHDRLTAATRQGE